MTWKYKTETVAVGGNSQDVREFTAGEMGQINAMTVKAKEAGQTDPMERVRQSVVFGATNPARTAEDVAAMPFQLLTACSAKIFELSGLGGEEEAEKKA